jgi:hypothetical protein
MWFKVDDKLHSHPKTLAAGNEAMGVWLRLGSWCSEHLTDGAISQAIALAFDPSLLVIQRLIDTGWLVQTEAGDYHLHDYLDWNPSKADKEKLSKTRALAGRKGGRQKLKQLPSKRSGKTKAKGTGTGTGTGSTKGKDVGDGSLAVWEAWKHDTGHHRAKFDDKRRKRIQARLNEGFAPDELIAAISNRHHDPWLMGHNDTGKVFDGLETLLRDAAQVERLRDLTAPLRPAVPAGGLRGADLADQLVAECIAERMRDDTDRG